MIKAKTIVVPVALQRYSDVPPIALRQRDLVEALALATRAQVVVLSCQANLGLVAQAETVAEKLEDFVKPLADAGIVVVQRLLDGRPGDVLPPVIDALDADLAVVGSHSKRSFMDVSIGTTASALIRAIKCPVILVRPTHEDEQRVRDLLIPHYPRVFAYV